MSSRTWTAKISTLTADEELASVIVRLMMVLNDIAIANDGLGEWTFTKNPKKLSRQAGGRLYYGRMLMSHVFEALGIIEDIKKSETLKAAVQNCDAKTRASFDAVVAFLTCADYKMLLQIRNSAGFHYDRKRAINALKQIDRKFPDLHFAYTLGHAPLDWYFELGDAVSDRIVVRDIFGAAEGQDVRASIDPILMRLHTMAMAFNDFAGHFIRQKLKR
jgi:hypothetical protein